MEGWVYVWMDRRMYREEGCTEGRTEIEEECKEEKDE